MLDKIKELCKLKGISVCKMEEELEFGRGYIGKLNKSSPTLKNAIKIADYLGISICELINRECNVVANSEKCVECREKALVDIEWMEELEKRFTHLVSMIGAVDISLMKEIVGISEMIEVRKQNVGKGDKAC